MSVWSSALVAGLWGGVLALERRAFLQAMASRPLVAGTVMGVLLGDVTAGVSVGLVFELLHLGTAALGAATPEHDTLPAVFGTAVACELGRPGGVPATPAMWAFAILLAAPLGRLGQQLEAALDRRARRYLGRAMSAAHAGDVPAATRQNLRAMWAPFGAFAVLTAAGVFVGAGASGAWGLLPVRALEGLQFTFPAIGVVAAAAAVIGSHARARLLWGGLSAAAVFLAVEGYLTWGGVP